MAPLPPSPSSSGDESSSSGDESSSDDEQLNAQGFSSQAPNNERKKAEEEEEPSRESGGEEDSDDEDEEESNDSEEHERLRLVSTTGSKPASESGDSDSGSDSDSEPAQLVTPLNSRPMERLTTNGDIKPNGRSHFQRVWSLEDEITILKGMVELMANRRPIKWNKSTLGDLHSLVADSLSIEVTESRLSGKVRKLKQKYLAFVKKGKDPKAAKGHDQSVFELAQKVWGNEVVDDLDAKGKPMKKKANETGVMMKRETTKSKGDQVMVKGAEKSLKRKSPLCNDVVAMVGNKSDVLALEKVDPEEVMTLEGQLKKARAVELKHSRRRVELLEKSLELVGEGIKSSIG